MILNYFVGNGTARYKIDIPWFNGDCILEYHEIVSAIEQCAQDYYENKDGWERKWPLDIHLYYNASALGSETVGLVHEVAFECL